MNILTEALDLIFPRQCAGCGAWDTHLCDTCLLLAAADPQVGALENVWGLPAVPVWSLGNYGGPLRRLILAAKHEKGRDLESFLFQAGASLAESVAETLESAPSICVITAPSSRRRRWDRTEITGHLAAGVHAGLIELLPGKPVHRLDAFVLRRGFGSQSARSGNSRQQGRRGAFTLVRELPERAVAIAVDDVLTTGATMMEMWRHLGLHLQAAVVLASA